MQFARLAIGIAILICATAVQAAPTTYILDPDRSSVRFTWFYGNTPIAGHIDISQAQVTLDLDRISGSDVQVALSAGTAQAGFLFATQALRGPQMFDADRFPTITFASDAFALTGGGVTVNGAVTIRGVTQPVVMNATLFRQEGTEPEDRDHLAIELVGAIDRHAFGASGFADEVGPRVELRILAYIDRAP